MPVEEDRPAPHVFGPVNGLRLVGMVAMPAARDAPEGLLAGERLENGGGVADWDERVLLAVHDRRRARDAARGGDGIHRRERKPGFLLDAGHREPDRIVQEPRRK